MGARGNGDFQISIMLREATHGSMVVRAALFGGFVLAHGHSKFFSGGYLNKKSGPKIWKIRLKGLGIFSYPDV